MELLKRNKQDFLHRYVTIKEQLSEERRVKFLQGDPKFI